MKKSELYHLAQMAVVTSPTIAPEKKLEILQLLMDAESFARYCEEEQAKKAEK